MSVAGVLEDLARLPLDVARTANILLTQDDAVVGATPKDVVWTHRKTTLYRYRSDRRRHAVPVLLVFALINRPDIFDLRPGNSFVEFLLEEGYDVFLVDWGYPGEEDADVGLEAYVCDELEWSVREVLRHSGSAQCSLVGWCIGAALSAMFLTRDARRAGGPRVRNAVLLTMPVDTDDCLYTSWLRRDSFDPALVTAAFPAVPGAMVDWANKMMKPVTNYVTTPRRLLESVRAGRADRVAHQTMAKWVADNPPFAGRAYREWITWMYQENRLVRGEVVLRGERVDLADVDASLLVVTADADHIAPRHSTMPFLDLVTCPDVTHLDRAGGHIGLMAGSKARRELWPDIAAWLETRSA